MCDKYKVTLKKIIAFAQDNKDIQAIIIVGSQCRRIKPADDYSDLDVIVCTTDPQKYIRNADWINYFGNPVCSFIETTFDGDKERRVLYDDNRDIDFPILPLDSAQPFDFLDNPDLLSILESGHRVLYDRANTLAGKIKSALQKYQHSGPGYAKSEIENLVNDFNYHIIWALKKLKRKELWTAVNCVNNYLNKLLLRMMKYHAGICNCNEIKWPVGRFLEEYIPDAFKETLKSCFCRYDESEAGKSIKALFGFFNELANQVYKKLGFDYDIGQLKTVKKFIDLLS